MPSGEPGHDKVQQGSEDGQHRQNRPLAVSCLYSVMSRLSAVVFPDVRIAIVVKWSGERESDSEVRRWER